MRTLAVLRIAVLGACTNALAANIGAQQQDARSKSSVWTGVFTAAQAERGKQLYGRYCARCHGDDLANSRNPLAGDRFTEHWESRTLADLFRRIRDTMPAGDVASVAEPDKLDAMIYVLQQNGFPEGGAQLTPDGDALATIQITGKSGPMPVRTGTVVRTAGCLEQGNNGEWQLTNASEPERAALDTPLERGVQPSPPAGSRTIVLLNPFPSPTAHRGHRIAITGFLVQGADRDAVNVVSIELLAQSCTP